MVVTVIITVGYSLIITAPGIKEANEQPQVDSVVIEEPEDEEEIVDFIHTSKRDSVIAFALKHLGTPYVYGSCSADGFDCSGFVYYVFKHFKIDVPRSSSQYKDFGKTISIEKVKKGDILVFLSPTRNEIGHLGIVTKPAGMETEFIHSSSGKEMEVMISSLKQEGYKRRYVKSITVL